MSTPSPSHDRPTASSLVDYLEASAERYPERVAVVDPTGAPLTYRELNERADRIAGLLRAMGVGAGDRVGLMLPKSAIGVTALFGIMKARAAYVPVDWTAPPERNHSIFSDCRVRAAFVDHRCLTQLVERPISSLDGPLVVVGGAADAVGAGPSRMLTWEAALDHSPLRERADLRSPDDLAYILYTSGSTGVPKGVMLSHRNALGFVDWCSEVFAPTTEDRFSSHAPFHFDLSILDLYVSLKHGATLFLVGEDLGKNPRELARVIAEQRLTVWYSTPSILNLLAEFGGLQRHDCSALRLVLFAGEVFPIKQLRRLALAWPHPDYFNLYGPTETNVCTYAEIRKPIPEERTEPYAIGWPCSHCDALVLDEDGTSVPRGEEGLLYIAGPSVFDGYWNRPEESSTRFLVRDGVRWYNTGDVVREDPEDGFIYVGRRDRMVKRRGFRIELGEIESGLYRHEQLREVAVVAASDPAAGTRIVAYVVPQAEPHPSIVELKAFCARQLPSYMSPDVFLFLDALPRTSTNKVDYQRLTRSLLDQVTSR